jgi:hypothetical protein
MHAAEQGMELRRTKVGSKILETAGCGQSVDIQVFIYLLTTIEYTMCVKRKTQRTQRYTFPVITGRGQHNLHFQVLNCSGKWPHILHQTHANYAVAFRNFIN